MRLVSWLKKHFYKEGYTLAEIIMVIIIVVIAASIAIPSYRKSVLNSRDREAKAMLRLIREAERVYRLEFNTYIDCSNAGNSCDDILKLSLPSRWSYGVSDAGQDSFCAQATGGGGTGNWHVNQDDSDVSSGSCP